MESFGRVLRRVDRELEVPEPERSRLLLELAGDLEELYRAYRRRGCSEDEARRRAEDWMAPDGGSIDELRRLHTPLAGRLLDALSDVARSRLETAVFTVLALGVVAAGLGGLRGTSILWPPGPVVTVLLGLGGLGLGIAALRAYRLVVVPDGAVSSAADGRPLPSERASAPSTLLAVAAGAILVGALGAFVELEAAFAEASALAASTTAAEAAGSAAAASASAHRALWSAASGAAGTVAVALLVALTLALAWFWLEVRVRRARLARAELLEVAPSLRRRYEPRESERSPR